MMEDHHHTVHIYSVPAPVARCVGCRKVAPSYGVVHCDRQIAFGCDCNGALCWTCSRVVEAVLDGVEVS